MLRVAASAAGTGAPAGAGRRQGQWILLDCFDVLVHIFMPDVRQFFGLEQECNVQIGSFDKVATNIDLSLSIAGAAIAK